MADKKVTIQITYTASLTPEHYPDCDTDEARVLHDLEGVTDGSWLLEELLGDRVTDIKLIAVETE